MTQTVSVTKIFDRMYNEATSEADKGDRFERFCQAYLQKDPLWAEQFTRVWRWPDWPGRTGHDIGVDLVAERVDGGLTAIQCKFYQPLRPIKKEDLDKFLAGSGRTGFTDRIFMTTSIKWGPNAETAIAEQAVPVRRISLADFQASRVDFGQFDTTTPEVLSLQGAAEPRPYQREAIQAVMNGFATHDRGRLIMACGTGKTFTSLRLAEQMVGAAGSVLFLVPSIALLSQALREWSNNAAEPGITAMAVCSDAKASKARATKDDSAEISVVDLALPATTDPQQLAARMKHARANRSGMRVVFATYQSIDVVAQAQRIAELEPFDLVICDEAHRTTGATLAGADESAFVRVHDAEYLKATKRLYMTATPRIYDDASKAKAGKAQAVLASMDDEDTFGPEFHRLGFGDAVSLGMLTDYKVLILTVEESMTTKALRESRAEKYELDLGDAARLIGCWNGLAKRGDAEHDFGADAAPMRRAVAFAKNIKASKAVAEEFTGIVSAYQELAEPQGDLLEVQVEHVDGSMNAMLRAEKLDWLTEDAGENVCRILSNARCLSEGVDVPSLDAVMFLNPRRSVVDVVQSVGRVMRLAPGKKYGYIILPVVIPAGVEPEQALDRNKSFDVVWEVLQALRAHDERFDAMVNQVELNEKRSERIDVIGVGSAADERGDGDSSSADASAKAVQGALDLQLTRMDALRNAIYARLVKKVGSRRYWEQWAKDIADIAQRHIERITLLVDDTDSPAGRQFERFLDALRRNLNDAISRQNAIEMLSQHMITKPVFEALFADYAFTASNPVSQVMDKMLAALTSVSAQAETESLERFYESVRARATGIDNAAGKQNIITELYESFFTTAFAKTADAMGVVYTPIEIVDFILRSVDDLLRAEFGRGVTDEGVHVLDPFTGTGTFIVRLLQSGLIRPEDLARKYASELHANEILLLAYYIAAINIETTFHDLIAQQQGKDLEAIPYESFSGIVLTDTFQLTEDGDLGDPEVFGTNNSRAEAQKRLDIRVIVGNPPYSVGQTSGNDDNANVKYPTLDARIAETFAARTDATNKNSLYDSYLRAIRWASDRIGDDGVIGFVTNGGWIEGNTAAGVRKTLAEEFSSIYVFNLRGNARTAGEQRQKEKGNVFGSGARTTVAVFLLVKRAGHTGAGTINYRDIGDYLSREEKLDIVRDAQVAEIEWTLITPNEYGDWLGQRDPKYLSYPAIGGDDTGVNAFEDYSRGLETNRDAWVYNSSRTALDANLARFLDTYEAERQRFAEHAATQHIDRPSGADTTGVVTTDDTLIKWNRSLRDRLAKGRPLVRQAGHTATAMYRPFFAQHIDHSDGLVYLPAVARRYFPTSAHDNLGFYVTGVGSDKEFSTIATRLVPDLALWGSSNGQFFPRYRWEPVVGAEEGTLDLGSAPSDDVVDGYRRIDNITDVILAHMRGQYGPEVTKDQIFYGIYGLLHSPEYRERYATELKQMLPRIPDLAPSAFFHFAEAGKELFELHADYEEAEPYPLEVVGGEQLPGLQDADYYWVQKMRFPKGLKAADEPTELIVNEHITLSGLPPEIYRYQLGSRSALEWIIRQHQVSTDKASGIVNDPNLWGIEHGNPRYIIDLIQKVATVSVRTQQIVAGLPGVGVEQA